MARDGWGVGFGEDFGRIDQPGHNYDPASLGLDGQLPCRPAGLVKLFELPMLGQTPLLKPCRRNPWKPEISTLPTNRPESGRRPTLLGTAVNVVPKGRAGKPRVGSNHQVDPRVGSLEADYV